MYTPREEPGGKGEIAPLTGGQTKQRAKATQTSPLTKLFNQSQLYPIIIVMNISDERSQGNKR